LVANDPDADRLAAAEQVLDADGNGTSRFVTFSGASTLMSHHESS
jgi:phosphomannomutase